MDIIKENLNQELLKLYSNDEFSKKILALENKSDEGYYEIVKTYIPEISFEKFAKDAKMIVDYYKQTGDVSEDGLLELDQLDDVAGGVVVGIIVALTIT